MASNCKRASDWGTNFLASSLEKSHLLPSSLSLASPSPQGCCYSSTSFLPYLVLLYQVSSMVTRQETPVGAHKFCHKRQMRDRWPGDVCLCVSFMFAFLYIDQLNFLRNYFAPGPLLLASGSPGPLSSPRAIFLEAHLRLNCISL